MLRMLSRSALLMRSSTALFTPKTMRMFSTETLIETGVEEKYQERKEAKRSVEKSAKIGNVRSDGNTLRWYKDVTVAAYDPPDGGRRQWKVQLDGYDIATPKENRLWAPSKALALAVAAEWQSQSDKVIPVTMPLMTLCTTTIDNVPLTRHTVVGNLLQFFQTDTICFRVSASAYPELYALQEKVYGSLMHWFMENVKCGIVKGPPGVIHPPTQPEVTLNVLRWHLHCMDDWQLAGLDAMTAISKSLIVSLATMMGDLPPDEALDISRLDEAFQIKQYGKVLNGHDLDETDCQVKFYSSALFTALLPLNHRAILRASSTTPTSSSSQKN